MTIASILFLSLAASVGFISLIKAWNFFARRYNDRLLAHSLCRSCNKRLGAEGIPEARKQWKKQVQHAVKAGKTGVYRSNLELRCPHCGTLNFEQDLYKAQKQREDK